MATLLLFYAAPNYFQEGKVQAALSISKSRVAKATVKNSEVRNEIFASELAAARSLLPGEFAPLEVGVGAAPCSGSKGRGGKAVTEVVAGTCSYCIKTATLVRIADQLIDPQDRS
jgi:hypothetical protein